VLELLNSGGSFVIEGAPGTGKSTITWFWACHQQFSSCWVGTGTFGKRVISILRNGQILYSSTFSDITALDFDLLNVDCLIIDGITTEYKEVLFRAYRWCEHLNSRRLIITSSVQASIKPEIRTGQMLGSVFVEGWKREMYEAALENDSFATEHPELLNEEEFDEKFYWAGASAR
jgi:hypothetical protein